MKDKIIRHASAYSVGTVAERTLNVVRGLVVARLLGPSSYGILTALMVLLDYARYSHLGTVDAINKQVPLYRGRKDDKGADEIQNSVLVFSTLVAAVLGVGVFAASFFAGRFYSPLIVWGLKAVAVLVVLQQVYFFSYALSRGNKRFTVLGAGLIIFSVANLLLTIVLALRYSLNGVLAALAVSYAIGALYLQHYGKYRLHFRLNRGLLRSLFKGGLLLMLVGISWVVLLSVDKLVIIRTLVSADLGHYGIAAMVANFIYLIPGAIAATMFPYFLEQYGKRKDAALLKEYLMGPLTIIALLMPIAIGLAFILLPLLIPYVLPAYLPSILPSRILICGAFFISIVATIQHFLLAIDKEVKIILTQVLFVVLAAALDFVAISRGYGIAGVAAATAVAYFLFSSVLLGYAGRYYSEKVSDYLKLFGKLYLPFFVVIAFAVGLGLAGLGTFQAAVVFLVGTSPLVFYTNRKFGLLKGVVRGG